MRHCVQYVGASIDIVSCRIRKRREKKKKRARFGETAQSFSHNIACNANTRFFACNQHEPVYFSGKLHKRRFSPSFPSCQTDKTAAARIHDQNIAMDIRPIVQST